MGWPEISLDDALRVHRHGYLSIGLHGGFQRLTHSDAGTVLEPVTIVGDEAGIENLRKELSR